MSEVFGPGGTEPAPPASPAVMQLKIAAIILIVFAALGWLSGLADGASRVLILTGGMHPEPIFGIDPAAHTGAVIFWLVLDIMAFFMAPVALFGAVQMLRFRMYGFTRVSAILAMLPVVTCCCCVVTLPVGIWALIVLNNPEVRGRFT